MSSKKKETTLIFSMAIGANYTFELISIQTCVIILRQCVGLKQLRIPNSLPYVHSFFRRQNGIWVKFQHFWPKNDGPKLIVLIELQSQAMKYDFFGLGEARAISDILQSCFTYPKPQPAFYSCTISSYYIYILDAVTSSGILKAKQKLGRTFNSDKLGGIAFTKISKLTMCSAQEEAQAIVPASTGQHRHCTCSVLKIL